MSILIKNKDQVESTWLKIVEEGIEQFHVLADFDGTITRGTSGGQKLPSLIAVLRDEEYLSPDYAARAQGLFEKYHPFENDTSISAGERKEKMHSWWQEHIDLLIASGLSKNDIESAMRSCRIQLRERAKDFFSFLETHSVPLVILSSSGLGADAISLFLENQNLLSDNIIIVSNKYIWDKDGKAIDIEKPIIHSLNKDETILSQLSFYDRIEKRKNVLLLGNSIDDVKMIEGFDYSNLLKIGFLNYDCSKQASYQAVYDIVIKDDGPMDYINQLLNKL